MDDIVAITLFRHGLTEGNRRREYMGWNDSPLTDTAKMQLANYDFQQAAYDLFLSSDSGRSLETIEKLFPSVEVEELLELREMDFGIFSGKTYEQLKWTKPYQEWLDNIYTYQPPNGESYPMFVDRVEKGWGKIVEVILHKQKKNVFIVTHGGVIRYLLTKVTQGEKNFWEWEISNGTGFIVKFQRNQLRRNLKCISLQEVPLTGNVLG